MSNSTTSALGLEVFPVTDVGKTRDHNEDSYLVDKKLGLFVVADGMGGHAAGEIASQLAVQAFRECLHRYTEQTGATLTNVDASQRAEILQLLERAVQEACTAVHSDAERKPERRGMGTTLSALWILGTRGFIAHVGDSRVYVLRAGAVHQLTEDHSLVNELIKRARLSMEQIENVKYKNAVTRAVGVYESVEADTLDFDVLPGDRFLVCSDGLHRYFDNQNTLQLLQEVKEPALANLLTTFANEKGGEDNITAIVVEASALAEEADSRVEEVNLKIETLQKMPIFRFLEYQELVRVLNITDVHSFSANTPIVAQGEEGDTMFVVLRGNVRVHREEAEITQLSAGQFFGEMALIDLAPRSASVTSLTDSKLLSIRRKDFYELLRKDQGIAVKLLWSFMGVLVERLRTTSKDLGEAKQRLSMDSIPLTSMDIQEIK